MAFQKPKVQPKFADLKAILAQAQKLDEPSYQLLQTLIDRLVQFQAVVKEELDSKGSGGGKPGEDGEPGPVGPQGPTGPQGPPGSSNAIPHQATHRPGGNDVLVNNAWTDAANQFTQRQLITGGIGGNYAEAPLEIQIAGPRISFHWPGIVASQIGMDNAGVIRTYDNPGTGYASFACGILTANGYVRSTNGQYTHSDGSPGLQMDGAVQMFSETYYFTNKANTAHKMYLAGNNLTVVGSIICYSINTNGWGVTFGPVTCGNVNTQGGSLTTGTLFSTTANIGQLGFNSGGYPALRAATNAHLVINAVPLYLQLDVPGNAVYVHGPTWFYYNVSLQAHLLPTVDGSYRIGTDGARFYTAFFALPPSASGPTIITAASGALYYLSSSRNTKQNFRPADLERSKKILDLKPTYFQNLDAKPEDPFAIGVMTDEVPEELNDLVFRAERKKAGGVGTELMESFYYDRVSMHLLVVMKDMNRRIEELETARGI